MMATFRSESDSSDVGLKLDSLFGWGWLLLVRAARLFLRNGWSRHVGLQIRTMACKTHIQTHLFVFFFSPFKIKNKDPDMVETPNGQAYWTIRRTSEFYFFFLLSMAAKTISTRQLASFHIRQVHPWGHNTSHSYIISSSTPFFVFFYYKRMCFRFETTQGGRSWESFAF